MRTVYLLRHGDYSNPRNILPGRLPVELSDLGLEQAQKLSSYFESKDIALIYSSAVRRCQQTAEIISQQQIKIINDARILEGHSAYQGFWGPNETNSGEWEYYKHIPELGGESLSDIQKRMVNFWEEVVLNSSDNLLICSHGDPIAVLYLHLFRSNFQIEKNTIPNESWLEKAEFFAISLEGSRVLSIEKQSLA